MLETKSIRSPFFPAFFPAFFPRNGVFRSVPELVDAIKNYIALHNNNPKPFVWTAKANHILAKVMRANRKLSPNQNE